MKPVISASFAINEELLAESSEVALDIEDKRAKLEAEISVVEATRARLRKLLIGSGLRKEWCWEERASFWVAEDRFWTKEVNAVLLLSNKLKVKLYNLYEESNDLYYDAERLGF